MSCWHGYTCRNCCESMISDNSGNCIKCGKPFGENHVEIQVAFLLCVLVFLFFILLVIK